MGSSSEGQFGCNVYLKAPRASLGATTTIISLLVEVKAWLTFLLKLSQANFPYFIDTFISLLTSLEKKLISAFFLWIATSLQLWRMHLLSLSHQYVPSSQNFIRMGALDLGSYFWNWWDIYILNSTDIAVLEHEIALKIKTKQSRTLKVMDYSEYQQGWEARSWFDLQHYWLGFDAFIFILLPKMLN